MNTLYIVHRLTPRILSLFTAIYYFLKMRGIFCNSSCSYWVTFVAALMFGCIKIGTVELTVNQKSAVIFSNIGSWGYPLSELHPDIRDDALQKILNHSCCHMLYWLTTDSANAVIIKLIQSVH